MGKYYYSVSEAAELVGKHRNTVLGWIRNGSIQSEQYGPKCSHRIPATSLKFFVERFGFCHGLSGVEVR